MTVKTQVPTHWAEITQLKHFFTHELIVQCITEHVISVLQKLLNFPVHEQKIITLSLVLKYKDTVLSQRMISMWIYWGKVKSSGKSETVTDLISDSPQYLRALCARFLIKKLDWVLTILILSRSDRPEYIHCLALFSKCGEKYYKMTESFVFQKLSRHSGLLIDNRGVFKNFKTKPQWKEHYYSNLACYNHLMGMKLPPNLTSYIIFQNKWLWLK